MGADANRRRRSIRLPHHDYASAAAYFVTICTYDRIELFGEIRDAEMHLGALGRLVADEWQRTAAVRPAVTVDAFVVMPNHLHGVLVLADFADAVDPVGASRRLAHAGQPSRAKPGTLGAIIGQFKSRVTKQARGFGWEDGRPIWQRNYYEHVIRDDPELDRIRAYIVGNPSRWHDDEYNTAAVPHADGH